MKNAIISLGFLFGLLPCLGQALTDSNITLAEALSGTSAPQSIRERLAITSVEYFSSDGQLHRGQIVIDSSLVVDIQRVFELIRELRYPVDMVIPIKFDLPNDGTTMSDLNNSYSFHYRAKIGGVSLSVHSRGRGFDINPMNNPYVSSGGSVRPLGSFRDSSDPRTLTADHPVVELFERLGWTWGGSWSSVKDYMHFEKK